jgi:hypothetical protein
MKTLIIGGLVSVALSAAAVSLQLQSQVSAAVGPSASAGGDSYLPIVSADGRFVLFASTAGNLALATNGLPYRPSPISYYNVYLRDRASNTVALVSVAADGLSVADQDATPTGISTNGQYALFETTADNVTPSATSGVSTVYLRDLVNGTTTLISANTNDVQADGDSYNSVLTPDGRHAAFTSDAPDLSADATNGIPNIFVYDRQAGTTVLASPGAIPGVGPNDAGSDAAAITPDGHYVAFYSYTTNLAAGATMPGDVYVRDLVAGTTTWASRLARAEYKTVTGSSNALACDPQISADGNFIAFLVASNGYYLSQNAGVVLRYDRASGQTEVIGTNGYVSPGPPESLENLSMTPDGQYVAYLADIGSTAGTNMAVYEWNAQSGTNTLVSADTNNAVPAAESCDQPAISADGQFVAFLSTGTLTTNASGNDWHVYRRDVAGAATVLVDADTNGAAFGDSSVLDVCLSADGQSVFFDSTLSTLTTNDHNGSYDVFVRDVNAGATDLVSTRHPLLPCWSGNGFSFLAAQALSQDGRYLTFDSYATDLVGGDSGQPPAIYVRDLYQGTTVLASAGLNGGGASQSCYNPTISGNGRYVAFTSSATNLAPGGSNDLDNIFVRDLQANTNSLESVNLAGTGGNGNSDSAEISYDGRFVLFQSAATDLATASYKQGAINYFVRDRQAGVTHALTTVGAAYASMTPDGHYVAFTDTSSSTSGKFYIWDSLLAHPILTNTVATYLQALSISPDGNRVAVITGSSQETLYVLDRVANTKWTVFTHYIGGESGLRFSADGNFLTLAAAPVRPMTNQIYLCNVPAQTTLLISHANGSQLPADGSSDSPDISADGRFVAYLSGADNLVAGDTNGVPDVFLYDTLTGSNVILSASIHGSVAGNERSDAPFFSGDGHTVVFSSLASDLVADDFNQTVDIFGYSPLYARVAGASNGNLTIDWPAAPGQTYTVQYKDALDDPLWQVFSGSVGTNGNRAFVIDSTAGAPSRFYRVMASKP